MKLKNLFTSIEITTQEMQDLMFNVPVPISVGVSRWIKQKFGLDLFSVLDKKDETKEMPKV